MFCWALAFGFHPTPQRASVVIGAALTKKPPTPEGQGGRTVKHRAMCKARRLIRRGIDPGFIHLEGGNPLLDVGMGWDSPQSQNRQGADLIRRRLCGGDLLGLQIHSDDQFSTQGFGEVWPFPLAPGGRGASRSEGEREPPSAPRSTTCSGLHPSASGRGALRSSGVRGRPGAANATVPQARL